MIDGEENSNNNEYKKNETTIVADINIRLFFFR
jgi:hypothetical protein